MRIVLGLGNPGTRYRSTRHNMGHRVVDRLAHRWGVSLTHRHDLRGLVRTSAVRTAEGTAILAKSTTYMNRSGRAARVLMEHYEASAEDLLVIYDDADLELGRVRIRPAGGAGGHNGVRAVIDALRTEQFPRIRLGVRGEERDSMDLADYVLQEFEPEEERVAEALVVLGAEAAEGTLNEGLQEAMNRYNGRSASDAGDRDSGDSGTT